jgi:endo-1,4-beta-D-glucanase Y
MECDYPALAPRYSVTHGGINAFNRKMTEEKSRLTLAEVRQELEDTHRRLVIYVASRGAKTKAEMQSKRVQASFDSTTGLYGKPPRYYDQNLALFAMGWLEHRFRFDSTGVLNLRWVADLY